MRIHFGSTFSQLSQAFYARAMAVRDWGNCYGCGGQIGSPQGLFMSRSYCSLICMHADGCRWVWLCEEIGDCGCTPYAKRRRVLRETRDSMRVMRGVLEDNDLMDEFEEAHEESCLPEVELDDPAQGPGEADESSDVEDETVALRAIVAARSEADVLHQLVTSAASLAERDRLHAENARLLAEADVRRQNVDTTAEDVRL